MPIRFRTPPTANYFRYGACCGVAGGPITVSFFLHPHPVDEYNALITLYFLHLRRPKCAIAPRTIGREIALPHSFPGHQVLRTSKQKVIFRATSCYIHVVYTFSFQ